MICPNCGNKVTLKRKRCDRCNEDLTAFQKIYKQSNAYYNIGLEKAKVRDLTGAIFVLKKSLEINKRNTNARNLLGLVYFEIGETVAALSEWVISKHFESENNEADRYINALQSNPTKLDALNQTIKKYNAALQSAKQGNEDLAVIQLKKVINLNPRFVKALQLLALLYLKNKEEEKARKYLLKARKIDVSNTITLKYLQELKEIMPSTSTDNKKGKSEKKEATPISSTYVSTPYKEDKPNIWVFVSLIAGILIGVIVSAILVVPTVREQVTNEFRDIEVNYNENLSKQTQTISSLENEKEDLEEEIQQLQAQLTEFSGFDDTVYDSLFQAIQLYLDGLTGEQSNPVAVAEALSGVDVKTLEKPGAVALYNKVKDAVYLEASGILYEEGHDLYSSKKYEEALPLLLQAYEYNPADVNAIYFIGRTYQRQDDLENAKKYYTILTENYPATKRADDARKQMQNLE